MARRASAARTIERTFGEAAVIIRTSGTYDDDNYWVENDETRTDVRCATAPMDRGDARIRQLLEDGVLLSALRRFWTIASLDPVRYATDDDTGSAGDIIEWDSQRWRIIDTQRWTGFSQSIGQRIEV